MSQAEMPVGSGAAPESCGGGEPTAVDLFGDGAPPRSTRDRLIREAFNLFQERGFHAVGLDQVIAAVGVTKTTFYNHFESKDALILAVMEQRDRWELDALMRSARGHAGEGATPRELLLAVFDALGEWFDGPDFRGCLFISAAAEFPNHLDPVHQAAAAHTRRSRGVIVELAADAGVADPSLLADRFMLLMQGATSLRHVTRQTGLGAQARGVAELLLREHGA